MLKIPESIDNKFKEGKTDSTYRTYLIMLSKLFKELFDTTEFSVDKLKETNKVKNYLKDLSVTSQKLISIAIVMILKASNSKKDLIDFYGKLAKAYRIQDKDMRKNREATEEEKITHITWSYIKEMKKSYKDFLMNSDKSFMPELAYKRLFMGWVCFELLTIIPPQRGECLFNCYINKDVKGSNIIDTKKRQWIIRESKTKRSYGERIIPLNDCLIEVIKQWMEISNCKDGLLICNDMGSKMSTQSYTQFLNSTVFRTYASRNVSTDDLRKAYVTHMIVHIGVDKKERDTMARVLGHSPETMMCLYFKPELETNILLGGN